jgi:hypothetical protein
MQLVYQDYTNTDASQKIELEVASVGNTLHILDLHEGTPMNKKLTGIQETLSQKLGLPFTSIQDMNWFVYKPNGKVKEYVKLGTAERYESVSSTDPRLHPRFLRYQEQ